VVLKQNNIMKTILLIQLIHLATEAAHQIAAVIHTLGHLVK
jgi:hypothetical protein